ncbi:MAG: DUF342 domain-containing protein [Bacillota bacterium]
MQKSVKVEAKNEKAALDKGYKILKNKFSDKISKDELSIELIKKGKKIMGLFGKKDNTYQVKIKDDIDKNIKELMNEVEIDGSFEIKFSEEGIFLKVFAPEGNGRRVRLQEVKEKLDKKKIEDVEEEKLEEVIRDANGEWEYIAPRKPELDEDAEIEIEISSDGKRAFLDYKPAYGGKKASLKDLKDKIKEAGIVFGIKEEKLKNVIENRVVQKGLLIAEGEEPKDPVDEKLKYHFSDKKESIGTKREDGSMDFYNRGLITNVSPSDTLVTIKDSKKGKPGHKVTGEEIPPREPKTAKLPSGKNVKEEDGKLVSEIEGQVVKDGKRVNVLPVHEVKGNVDMNTGNIEFVGNVVVKGDVDEGFKIKAGGNVQIGGHVSAAQIESGGQVIIKKGFVGKEKGRIDAKGNVEIKFVENGHIKAEGSIKASDAVMHSDLNAAEDIIVTENKGLLVGGRCQAGHNIEANIVGSTMATKTVLEAGVDQETKEELDEIKEELKESEQNLLKTKRAIKALKEIKEKQGKLPTDKEVMFQRLLKTKKVIEKSIEKKESKKAELEEILNNVERGKVKVHEKVFSGVKMIIGKSQFNVHKELHHSSFIEENGEIRQIPL